MPMRRSVDIVALVSTLVGCSVETESTSVVQQQIIYGNDDRTELYDLGGENRQRQASVDSVAAMVPFERIHHDGDDVFVDGPSWSESESVCPSVRFSEQPVVARCSAVLMQNDLVLTAGHCARLCSQTRFVFGLFYEQRDILKGLSASHVYDCVDVVEDVVDESGVDFAWLRLDRPVAVGKPAAPAMRMADVGDQLTLASFPSGVPMKVDPGGVVTEVDGAVVRTTHDAFSGSSGGPLLDGDGQVVGVLGGGGPDLVATDAGCLEPRVIPEDVGLERATSIAWAMAGLCERSPSSCGEEPTATGCTIGSGKSELPWYAFLWLAVFFRRATIVGAHASTGRDRCEPRRARLPP